MGILNTRQYVGGRAYSNNQHNIGSITSVGGVRLHGDRLASRDNPSSPPRKGGDKKAPYSVGVDKKGRDGHVRFWRSYDYKTVEAAQKKLASIQGGYIIDNATGEIIARKEFSEKFYLPSGKYSHAKIGVISKKFAYAGRH